MRLLHYLHANIHRPLNRTAANATAASAPGGEASTIFGVLAGQARNRSRAELWMTALGGTTNAVLVAWQYPALNWLASGFVAAAAYGIWGLADRALEQERDETHWARVDSLLAVRAAVATVGAAAALWTLATFMRAALRGWIS